MQTPHTPDPIATFLAKWRMMTEAEKWAFIAMLDQVETA